MDTPRPTIDERLRAEENRLQAFTRRLFVVEAIQEELKTVTREKPFVIWNDIVWRMVLDTRNAFVIHFASWVRSMYEKGGFLRQLQAHHVRELKAKHGGSKGFEDRTLLQALLRRHHDESFKRLFPSVTTSFPRPGDVEQAKDAFSGSFAPVVGDRDSNRAHPYETEYAKNSAALDTQALRDYVTRAQQFLNDIRLVSRQSVFSYSNANLAPIKSVAEETVDQILIGTGLRRRVVQGTRSRASYYEELHALHDKLTADPKPMFNDTTKITRTV